MTDEEKERICKIIEKYLPVGITLNEAEIYAEAIPRIADELRAERNLETVKAFKKLCVDNADCNDCKRLGIFEKCQKTEKAGKKCEEFFSEFLNEMLMIKEAEK